MDVPKEERLARYQELYDRVGFALWLGNYSDSFMSQDAADEVAEFLASKIRERVTDPETALAPRLSRTDTVSRNDSLPESVSLPLVNPPVQHSDPVTF